MVWKPSCLKKISTETAVLTEANNTQNAFSHTIHFQSLSLFSFLVLLFAHNNNRTGTPNQYSLSKRCSELVFAHELYVLPMGHSELACQTIYCTICHRHARPACGKVRSRQYSHKNASKCGYEKKKHIFGVEWHNQKEIIAKRHVGRRRHPKQLQLNKTYKRTLGFFVCFIKWFNSKSVLLIHNIKYSRYCVLMGFAILPIKFLSFCQHKIRINQSSGESLCVCVCVGAFLYVCMRRTNINYSHYKRQCNDTNKRKQLTKWDSLQIAIGNANGWKWRSSRRILNAMYM